MLVDIETTRGIDSDKISTKTWQLDNKISVLVVVIYGLFRQMVQGYFSL